jgi:hypothetical protein
MSSPFTKIVKDASPDPCQIIRGSQEKKHFVTGWTGRSATRFRCHRDNNSPEEEENNGLRMTLAVEKPSAKERIATRTWRRRQRISF